MSLRFKSFAISGFIFLLLCSSTAGFSLWIKKSLRTQSEEKLQKASQEIKRRIENRFAIHQTTLRGLSALFALPHTSPEDATAYLQQMKSLEKYPGIQSVRFIRHAPSSDQDTEKFIIEWVQPHKGNEADLGIDLATDPDLRKIFTLSRKTSRSLLGSGTGLPSKGTDTKASSFFIILPIITSEASNIPLPPNSEAPTQKGFVSLAFNAKIIFEDIFSHRLHPEVRVEIFNTLKAKKDVLLFSTQPLHISKGPQIQARSPLDIVDQKWDLRTTAPEDFGLSRIAHPIPALILIAGFILSFLLAGFIYLHINAYDHAKSIAQSMTLEFRKARDEALEASRAKSEFLAMMSHEIRTPMNAIIGMADLLSKTNPNPQQHEYIEILKRSGDGLLAVINDVLDLSKVESGHLDLEEINFDLIEAAQRTLELLAVKAHSKGIELLNHVKSDVPRHVKGDPNRLRQMLVNLIGNSIKFTETGEVALEIELLKPLQEGTHRLGFSVRDTGAGIAEDKLDAIFEPFTQADTSTTRKYGGTGLGLSITKKLVTLMDGEISVTSTLGKGSTFRFEITLRAADNASKASASDVKPPASLKGMRVLITDDNETNRLILSKTLDSWGMVLDEAKGGVECLELIEAAKKKGKPYDLLVLDCRMPDLGGFDVAEKIKNDPAQSELIIMMLTSDGRKGDLQRAQTLHLEGYVLKPVKEAALLNAVLLATGKETAQEKKPDAAEKETPVRALKILLAEDGEDNQMLIQYYLKNTGHTLQIAENGEEAVKQFEAEDYDIVLMDIQMPVMDGYDAAKAIREIEQKKKLKKIPMIALSANAFREDIQKSLAAGCDAHLSKPIKQDELLKALQDHTQSAY